jgi:methylthioribulose-1-phosphate dehydratase
VHTVFNNLISEYYGEQGFVPVQGIELIKAFNIWEENAAIQIHEKLLHSLSGGKFRNG